MAQLIETLDKLLWGWPLIITLLGTHIFMTVRTGFVQKEVFRAINTVSGMQYDYIVKMGLDTPQNRAVFLQSYLVCVWRDIEAMYRDRGTKSYRNAVLDELRSFEFVKQARCYLSNCGLPAQERLGIAVFYQNDNRKMNAYMAVYPLLRKIQRGFSRIFG